MTSLNGFRSLQRIRGQQLYTAVTGEGGFALYILNNPLLTTLEGLQSLTEIRGNDVLGQGRVRLIDNDNLCYAERVDWSQLLGDNWWRALSPLSNGASVNCAAKSCNADCSCSSTCFSDTLAGCQGDCTEDDKWDTYIIILIIVFAVVVAVTVVLYFCCSSDRLGCKMRCCDSTCTAGALADKPGTKALYVGEGGKGKGGVFLEIWNSKQLLTASRTSILMLVHAQGQRGAARLQQQCRLERQHASPWKRRRQWPKERDQKQVCLGSGSQNLRIRPRAQMLVSTPPLTPPSIPFLHARNCKAQGLGCLGRDRPCGQPG